MTTRVAISVQSMDGLESVIDPRFGRAFAYVIVDINNNTVIAQLENKARQDAHGAGTGAAKMMSNNQVDTVISGRFGPKAFKALSDLGIEMWTAPDGINAKDAISKLSSGNLNRESSPSGGGFTGGQGKGRGMGQRGGMGQGKGRGGGSGMGQGKGRGRGGQNK